MKYLDSVVRRSLEFAVRQAIASDLPLIAHHRAAMFRDMGKLASHQEEALRAATASYWRDALETGEYIGWVAEATGTSSVISGAGAQIRPILPRPRSDSEELKSDPKRLFSMSTWNRFGGGAASPTR